MPTQNLEGGTSDRMKMLRPRFATERWVLTGHVEILNTSPGVLMLDPGGTGRNVTLPPVQDGQMFWIAHVGLANALTVKDAGGTTIAVLSDGDVGIFFCDATDWAGFTSASVGGGGVDDAFKVITDGTNSATATGEDSFKIRVGSLLTAVVANDDATHGDNVLIDVAEMAALTVLANATNSSAKPTAVAAGTDGHVFQRNGTALDFSPLRLGTAGSTSGQLPVAKGGTGQSTQETAFNALAPITTKGDLIGFSTTCARVAVGTDGYVLKADSGAATGLAWAAANAHVHTSADISDLTEVVEDFLGAAFADSSTIDFTYNDGAGTFSWSVIAAAVDHDALLNFVAAEHVDHSGVSITAGDGLTGGGTIESTRTLNVGAGTGIAVSADAVALDLNSLTTDNTGGAAGDFIPFVDVGSGNELNKVAVSDLFINAGAVLTSREIISGNGLTGGGDLSINRTLNVGAGTGIKVNADDVELDITGLTAETAPAVADLVAIEDASETAKRKMTLANLWKVIALFGDVTPATGDKIAIYDADGAAIGKIDWSVIASAGVSDGDKGDITVSGTGATWTIDNNVVSNAKLATAAAWTVKIRNAGSTGNVSDAALADITEEGTPASGDFVWLWLASGEIRKVAWDNLPGGEGGSGIAAVVEDTSPQLGGDLDSNGFDILFDDATGIKDDSDNWLLRFQKAATAVNHFDLLNSATGDAIELQAIGSDTDISIKLVPKGAGNVQVGTSRVLTVADEGTGNGLDADTVDGVEASAFLTKADNLAAVASPSTAFANIKQNASTSVTGVVEYATDGEAQAKSSTAHVLSPSNLAALAATDAFAGLTEYASDGEAQAKSATDRSLTPANLAALTASDTFAGLTEHATTTEALTGTATNRSVTPDALAALWEKGSDVASAGTLSLGEGGYFRITGTATITDIDFATAKDGRWAWLYFEGALTLTHHATTLVLPGGVNITTAAGDIAFVVQDNSDNVKVAYFPVSGKAVVPPAFADITSKPTTISGYGLTDAAAKTQTFQWEIFIEAPDNQDYRVVLDCAFAATITEVVTRCGAGTCTLTTKINTTALGGTANSVSTSEQAQSHGSANSVSAGDDIVLTVSSNSSCTDMSVKIEYTRSLS